MKKQRRIKKQIWIIGIVVLLVIVLAIFGIQYLQYRGSNEYKLKKLGYTKEEVSIVEKLSKEQITSLIKIPYHSNISKLIEQKYFIYANLERYLSYQKENPKEKLSKTIAFVNVNADYDYYDEEIMVKTKVDLKDSNLILVNKYHYLDKNFAPNDIVEVSNWYCYGENEIRKEVYEQFRKMEKDAVKEDLKLIITSSYREYDYQDRLWKKYANKNGEEWADSVAARPGHSEHQTGLSIDIVTNGEGSSMDKFAETEEAKWLMKNAYKYGFILRYPEGKEDITGYAYESWHYRYVGKKVAKEIKERDITYDEYYAYYKSEIEG